MLILFETPVGYALFNVLDEGKITDVESFQQLSESHEGIAQVNEAAGEIVKVMGNKVEGKLKRFLERKVKNPSEKLLVCEKGLAQAIKSKLKINSIFSEKHIDIMRGIRSHLTKLLHKVTTAERMEQMRLGLSHTLARYTLKFSSDKVDKMIVQAINLLDDLEKEVNIYAMRLKEWYGWHFPELARVVPKSNEYAQVVLRIKTKEEVGNVDLSDILEDESIIEEVREHAKNSMGTKINPVDLMQIQSLATEVVETTKYKEELKQYLSERMTAIAPNLTHLVGEIVGARLIAHAGSLVNLAKAPSSTVQIYGAEKALFTALRAKQPTPKYGLIYHAKMVGGAAQQHKGRIARSLAAKCSLASRVDAFTQKDNKLSISVDAKEKLEKRIERLDGIGTKNYGGSGGSWKRNPKRSQSHPAKFQDKRKGYTPSSDITKVRKKRKAERDDDEDDEEYKKKRVKRE